MRAMRLLRHITRQVTTSTSQITQRFLDKAYRLSTPCQIRGSHMIDLRLSFHDVLKSGSPASRVIRPPIAATLPLPNPPAHENEGLRNRLLSLHEFLTTNGLYADPDREFLEPAEFTIPRDVLTDKGLAFVWRYLDKYLGQRQDYPIADRLTDWHFRFTETSSNVWLAEGSDIWGRTVSCQGHDQDELLAMCIECARRLDKP